MHIRILDLLFFDFLDLDESPNVLSALTSLLTILLLSALNAFRANNPDDPIVFNIEVSDAAILLKFQMKRR